MSVNTYLHMYPCKCIAPFSGFDFEVDFWFENLRGFLRHRNEIHISCDRAFLDCNEALTIPLGRPHVQSSWLFCRFFLQRHIVWGPPINSARGRSRGVTKRLLACLNRTLIWNTKDIPLKHRQNISLKVFVRIADPFMKVWRNEYFSCRRSITSIFHMLWRSSSWNRKALKQCECMLRRKVVKYSKNVGQKGISPQVLTKWNSSIQYKTFAHARDIAQGAEVRLTSGL